MIPLVPREAAKLNSPVTLILIKEFSGSSSCADTDSRLVNHRVESVITVVADGYEAQFQTCSVWQQWCEVVFRDIEVQHISVATAPCRDFVDPSGILYRSFVYVLMNLCEQRCTVLIHGPLWRVCNLSAKGGCTDFVRWACQLPW